jgi:hypothetical protein
MLSVLENEMRASEPGTRALHREFEQLLREGEELGIYEAGQRGGGPAGDRWTIATCYTAETGISGTASWRKLGWTFRTVLYKNRLDVVLSEEKVAEGDMPEPWRSEIGHQLPDERYGWTRIN